MLNIRIAFWTLGLALVLCLLHAAPHVAAGQEYADEPYCEQQAGGPRGGGLFGWRNYSQEERRNFPTCYGGFERYYGAFHANYFRDYPVNNAGLNNNRYGWGSGWAW
jgi:hypothetical protein